MKTFRAANNKGTVSFDSVKTVDQSASQQQDILVIIMGHFHSMMKERGGIMKTE
jgi:hypothetical protein